MNSWLQRIQPTDGASLARFPPLPRSRGQRDATMTAGVPPGFWSRTTTGSRCWTPRRHLSPPSLARSRTPRTAGPGHGRPTTPASTEAVTRARGAWATRLASQLNARYHFGARSRVRLALEDPTPNTHFRVMAPPSLLPSVFAEERHATRCQRHDRSRPVNRARTAIIIGGGIAGPATAMALAKAGLEATVYEARPHGADGGGVMLTLAVNGIDALRTLGADAAAVAAGFPTPQITLRTHTGKRLGVTSTDGALADGTVAHTIRRANLYQALHSQA